MEITPAAWIMARHVARGRAKLNFSDWCGATANQLEEIQVSMMPAEFRGIGVRDCPGSRTERAGASACSVEVREYHSGCSTKSVQQLASQQESVSSDREVA